MKFKILVLLILVFFFSKMGISNDFGLDLSDNNSYLSTTEMQFQVFSPFLIHSVFLSGKSGLSTSYQYPGFYNGNSGQLNLFYTTSSQDSYHFGLGFFNLHLGIMYVIKLVRNGTIILLYRLACHLVINFNKKVA